MSPAGSDDEEEQDQSDNEQLNHNPPARVHVPPASVQQICHQLKKRKNLSPQSEADLDIFAVRLSILTCTTF